MLRPTAPLTTAVVLSLALHVSLGALFYLWPLTRGIGVYDIQGHSDGGLHVLLDPLESASEEPQEPVGELRIPHLKNLSTDTNIPTTTTTPGDERSDSPRSPRAPAGATFFQIGTQAKKIVYVLDASASMSHHQAWWAACRELWNSLQLLSDDVAFQIVVYNHHARPLLSSSPGWLRKSPELLQQIVQALRNLPIEGRTEHTEALKLALSMQPDAIFFLTDADDLDPAQLPALQRCNSHRAAIHTIELTGIHRDRPDMPMQLLAKWNRGQYRAVELR